MAANWRVVELLRAEVVPLGRRPIADSAELVYHFLERVRQPVTVIQRPGPKSEANLFQIVNPINPLSSGFSPGKRRQEHRRQDGNDANDNEHSHYCIGAAAAGQDNQGY